MTSIEGIRLVLDIAEGTAPVDRPAADVAQLVLLYSRTLYRVAYSVLRNPQEAEDVVQDVFLRVLRQDHTLAAIRDLRVWLVRIAWNLALDRRRRRRPDQLDPAFAERLVAIGTPADQRLQQAQRLHLVLSELERLPRAERHVLLLSAVDELTAAELAQVLGKSESAVRALLFRARTRLRQRLEKGNGSR